MTEQNKKLEVIKKRCLTSSKVITVIQIIAIIGIVGSVIGAIALFSMKDTINQTIAEQLAAGTATIDTFKFGGSGLLQFSINYEEMFQAGNYATPLTINCVVAAVITAITLYLLSLFKKIFKKLIDEENPFSDSILSSLKVCFIIATVILVAFVGLGIGIIGGLLCWCIYSILEYGKVLQTEVDETL